jgi:hypothetical protein
MNYPLLSNQGFQEIYPYRGENFTKEYVRMSILQQMLVTLFYPAGSDFLFVFKIWKANHFINVTLLYCSIYVHLRHSCKSLIVSVRPLLKRVGSAHFHLEKILKVSGNQILRQFLWRQNLKKHFKRLAFFKPT